MKHTNTARVGAGGFGVRGRSLYRHRRGRRAYVAAGCIRRCQSGGRGRHGGERDAAKGEDLALKERKRIRELGMPRGSYPQFDVAVKGQKVVVKFNIPSTCNVSHLIVDLVTHIGLEAGYGSEMLLRAWDSAAARQITLNAPKKMASIGDNNEDDLFVLIFEPLVGSEYSEIESIKHGSFSLKELEALISALKLSGQKDVKESSGKIDGFEQDRRVVVIAATNRKEDLDPALISRFDSIICFGLPDQQTRVEIASQYAKHLTKSELAQFSLSTEEMSGRDIRDVCMQTERHRASKLIRGQVPKDEKGEPSLPPIDEYVACAEQRRNSVPDRTRRTSRSSALKLA